MRWVRAALCLAVILGPSVMAVAAGPIVVDQFRRAFSLHELRVQRGQTVRFSNTDEFLHQIYIDSQLFKFVSREQSPGESVDISFPVAGTFDVRCEIHPKMLLKVIVE